MVDKYKGYIELLSTIPSVDRSSALTILSEIGVGMTQLGSSNRLCCWADPFFRSALEAPMLTGLVLRTFLFALDRYSFSPYTKRNRIKPAASDGQKEKAT